jgi:hypothetical protein
MAIAPTAPLAADRDTSAAISVTRFRAIALPVGAFVVRGTD